MKAFQQTLKEKQWKEKQEHKNERTAEEEVTTERNSNWKYSHIGLGNQCQQLVRSRIAM